MANNPNPVAWAQFRRWVSLSSIVGWCFCVFLFVQDIVVVADRVYHTTPVWKCFNSRTKGTNTDKKLLAGAPNISHGCAPT